ncbi:Transposon TX1 uncharacterized 149 kDa protein [Linum perenne]
MDNPSVDNMEVVAALTDCWNTARTAEESFLKQKARENWVNLGDSNTKFFHSSLKCRQAYNQIVSLNTADGRTVKDLPEIINEAVGFYEKLLGTPDCSLFKQTDAYFEELLIHKIPADDANSLCSPVSDEEIKSALFSMRGDKSPGPDGFSAFFFQNSWDLVGKDFTSGVRFFFESSSMPRKVRQLCKVDNVSSSNSWDSSLQEVVSVSSHGGAKAATLRVMWRAINSHIRRIDVAVLGPTMSSPPGARSSAAVVVEDDSSPLPFVQPRRVELEKQDSPCPLFNRKPDSGNKILPL